MSLVSSSTQERYKMTRSDTLPKEPDDSDEEGPYSANKWYRTNTRSVGTQRRSPDEDRSTILSGIKKMLQEKATSEDIKEAYEHEIRQCLIGGQSGNILHWILWKAEHGIRSPDASWHPKASLEMVKIALEHNADLVMEVGVDRMNETALHISLKKVSDHSYYEKFISMIRKNFPEQMAKALSVQNHLGETCIHIAVAHELDIASQLVEDVSPETLELRRCPQGTAVTSEGIGNTALHDAVVYERCSYSELSKEPVWVRQERVLKLIQCLIRKAPKTLAIRNSDDMTPYLYYINSKQKREDAIFKSRHDVHIYDADEHTMAGKAQMLVVPGSNRRSSTGNPRLHISADTINSDASKYRSPEQPIPDQVQEGTTNSAKGEISVTSRPEGNESAKAIPSDEIATKVECYLIEGAFMLKGFKQACECFFGKNRGKLYSFLGH